MNTTPTTDTEQWLQQNRALRMDANKDLFPEDRRAFHLERYRFARGFCENRIVLDAACGTGYGTAILAEKAARVQGVDFSHEAVAYAASNYGSERVAFRQSFVELTPFENDSFDVVVSFETVEHTLCPVAHMREIVRLLKKDGTAILSVPNRWGLTKYHYTDFDFKMFQELLAPHFGKAAFYYDNPDGKFGRPSGIGEWTEETGRHATCIIAVVSAPCKATIPQNPSAAILDEIYGKVSALHREYLALARRERRRPLNQLRLLPSRIKRALERLRT